jgi:hypothetical protein
MIEIPTVISSAYEESIIVGDSVGSRGSLFGRVWGGCFVLLAWISIDHTHLFSSLAGSSLGRVFFERVGHSHVCSTIE